MDYLEKIKVIDKICADKVREVFDPTEFEIVSVFGGIDWKTNQPYCVVDFRRKGMEAEVECDSYCSDAVDAFGYKECDDDEECLDRLLEECTEECKDNVKRALTGSIKFDPVTLRVHESTIPTGCQDVWGAEMTLDEFEEFQERKKKEIGKYGCYPDQTSWIHPHEMVPVEMPELGYEEYPAVCYYHVSDCSLRSLIRMMKDGVV